MWNTEADKGRSLFLEQKLTISFMAIILFCYLKLRFKKDFRLKYHFSNDKANLAF